MAKCFELPNVLSVIEEVIGSICQRELWTTKAKFKRCQIKNKWDYSFRRMTSGEPASASG